MNKTRMTLAALAGLAITVNGLSAARLAAWMMEKAEISDTVTIPCEEGTTDFSLDSTTGVDFGPKPGVGKDGKSLVFDGTMEAPLRTDSGVPNSEKLVVKINVMPTGKGDRQTIFASQPYFELRVIPDQKKFNFIHWGPDGKTYTSVNVACKMNAWNEVEGRIEDGKLVLIANGKKAEAKLKSETSLPGDERKVQIGCSARKEQNPDNRAFVGAISQFEIFGE